MKSWYGFQNGNSWLQNVAGLFVALLGLAKMFVTLKKQKRSCKRFNIAKVPGTWEREKTHFLTLAGEILTKGGYIYRLTTLSSLYIYYISL